MGASCRGKNSQRCIPAADYECGIKSYDVFDKLRHLRYTTIKRCGFLSVDEPKMRLTEVNVETKLGSVVQRHAASAEWMQFYGTT